MDMNKAIIIFGFIFAIFVGVVFYQFNTKLGKQAFPQPSNSTITSNNHTFKLTVVKTQKDQEIGLSKYTSLPQDQGMLFLFDKPDFYNFWMKNMKFPIDIIFIRDNTIVTVAENVQPPKSTTDNLPTYPPEAPVDKVLEISAGLSKKYNIKKGDTVKINL
jgi:uncharacterized membrane protein (UPF0127 family)